MKAYNLILAMSGVGCVLGVYGAYVFSQRPPAQPPAFEPAANPYEKGIYAQGIVESSQSLGSNTNIYPEVTGPITAVFVTEGAKVKSGDPLLTLDDSVQRATAEQQRAQAQAALAMLEELKAEPRPENLAIDAAQVVNAKANLKNAQDHLDKMEAAYKTDKESISLDDLDVARNAVLVADTNLTVVQKQYDLLKAGAWSYDIQNQEMQYQSLSKAAAASEALLAKYTLRAPCDGVVLSIQTAVGSYVSSQGAYDSYTQGLDPLIVMGTSSDHLEVRCYVDEILISQLPPAARITAKTFIRGTNVSLPMKFERMQPFVSPKIELADQRQERVDVRVLPLIFRFDKPASVSLFPGELVDVYIGQIDKPVAGTDKTTP